MSFLKFNLASLVRYNHVRREKGLEVNGVRSLVKLLINLLLYIYD